MKLICVKLEPSHTDPNRLGWYAYVRDLETRLSNMKELWKAVEAAFAEEDEYDTGLIEGGALGLDEQVSILDMLEVENLISKETGLRRFYVASAF